MKPLRALLVVKNRPGSFEREARGVGYFSYAVPEFTWDHLVPRKWGNVDTRALARDGYDVVFSEDGGFWGRYTGGALPVIYFAVDSTNSERHYKERLAQAAKADLVLVEHDRLKRFKPSGRKVRRWGYSTNDRIFHPREKVVDVAYHCNSGIVANGERARIRSLLRSWCAGRGYSCRLERLSTVEYARSLGEARVIVNLPQAPLNRPHRVIDAMASGGALLTAPVPDVSGEDRQEGRHYLVWRSDDELLEQIDDCIQGGWWQDIGAAGYAWAVPDHTWGAQAGALRQIIHEELKI